MTNNIIHIDSFTTDKEESLYLIFKLDNKKYAIPAKLVLEILRLPKLQLLEKAPDYIAGLLNIKGHIHSVIDIKPFLGLAQKEYSLENQVLVIETKEKTIGLIVDRVEDVIQADENSLEKIPYDTDKSYLKGVLNKDNDLIAFIDVDNLFKDISKDTSLSSEIKPNLFPQDSKSTAKLEKRALNIQKEIKLEITNYNLEENRFVSFSLNQELFCISLKFVKEFCKLNLLNLTQIPCVPDFIEGIVNLRGDFITIINLRNFLDLEKSPTMNKNKVIVIKDKTQKIGFLIDDVYEIINIPTDKLISTTKQDKNSFLLADVIQDDGKVLSVLDVNKILEDEKLIVEDAV